MKVSNGFDWIDALTAFAVLMILVAVWACTPVLQLNIPKKRPPQKELSCEDCHGDFHRLTPMKSGSGR